VLTQVHCHTNQSDGSHTPATIVANYLAAGYGALAITDHDKVTTQPAGITTAIPGNEHSPTTQHIIAIDADYLRGSETDAQTIIDGINADGGKASIAHPKWFRGMTYAEMAGLTDYLGMEIHNGHCVPGSGQNPVTYLPYAVDRWDELLTNVRRDVWGLAVDDLHTTGTYSTVDMGGLHVFVESNTAANIMAALASGNFVASVGNQGVTPGYPTRTDEDLSLSAAGAVRIEAWGADGLLSSTNGSSHTHTFDGSEQYVRLVTIGDYTEGFGSALSNRWAASSGTWTVGSGVLSLASDGNAHNLILRRHREGDFTAQIDVMLGDNQVNEGALLLFNVLSGSYYYGLRIGVSSTGAENNNLALRKVNNGSSSIIANTAYTATEDVWHRVKMSYTAATGRVQAKVWAVADPEPGSWMIDHADTTWTHGAFGLRANYAPTFDDLHISGFQSFYQPVTVD
jgi:hypothetical protein